MRSWGFRSFLAAATLAVVCSLPSLAAARNVEPGSVWVGGSLGPGFKLGSSLGGSGSFLLLGGNAEYAINKYLGVVADLQLGNLGFIGTAPFRLRLGARYRLAGLGLPVAPYGEAKLSVGRLWDVLGADLTILGLHVAGGADYFLTAKLAVGGRLGLDLGMTTGPRSAFFGTVEVMATVTYALWGPSPASPAPATPSPAGGDAGAKGATSAFAVPSPGFARR